MIGNIILSRASRDKHAKVCCEVGIKNAKEAIEKLPRTKRSEPKAKALETIIEANEKRLASLNAAITKRTMERPTDPKPVDRAPAITDPKPVVSGEAAPRG